MPQIYGKYGAGKTPIDPESHTAEESVAAKNINPEAIPDKVEGENNYGILGDTIATGYNAAKIVAEEVMMPLPLAERLLGWNLYSDEGSEYSGIKDFFSEWGKQTLEAPDFVPISKSQRDSDFLNRIEDYKQNYVLTGDKITEHLNKALGLDISSINNKDDPGSLISKYKGNAEVSNAVSNEIKKLEDNSINFIYFNPPYAITRKPWDKPLDYTKLWDDM